MAVKSFREMDAGAKVFYVCAWSLLAPVFAIIMGVLTYCAISVWLAVAGLVE